MRTPRKEEENLGVVRVLSGTGIITPKEAGMTNNELEAFGKLRRRVEYLEQDLANLYKYFWGGVAGLTVPWLWKWLF